MATDKRQIKELLGTGLSNEIVATAVGCDSAYISQLLSDEVFAGEVTALRAAALTANSKRDRKIDGIEDALIVKLEELMDSGVIYKPNDVLRAFTVINNAKRRGVSAAESITINNTVVNLSLPNRVVREFVQNAQGEVVEVEGQTLVTMPAHQLLKNLVNRGDGSEKYARVSRFLPTTIEQVPGEANTATQNSPA
jgi:hypothetical protein